MVTYAIDQLAEQVVGPGFYLRDRGSQEALRICEAFCETVNAKAILLRVVRELGLYGNSCLERRFTAVEKDPTDAFKAAELGEFVSVQPLPISTMRVVPSMFTGADPPKGYTQIIQGQWRRFAPQQIAWFKINITGGQVGSDFYGQGFVQPILDYIWGIQVMQDYMIRIMKRYAAPKIYWAIGTPEAPASPEAMKDWAATLQKIKPDEDWVGPWTNKPSTIEPSLTARFEEYVDHFQAQIITGLENPNLILSLIVLRVSDASATAMQDAWNKKITAIQDAVKELWEDFIFKPLIVQAGLDESVTPELVWGQVQVTATNPESLVQQITLLLNPKNVAVSQQTRFDLENLLRENLKLTPLPPAAQPQAAAAATAALGQIPVTQRQLETGKASTSSAQVTGERMSPNGNGNSEQTALAEKIRELEVKNHGKR